DNNTPLEIYNSNEETINAAIDSFIENQVNKNTELLKRYNLSQSETDIKFFTVNYIISNIEYHKLYFSDPYQYKDELKRIKSALSPRQPLLNNSPEINDLLNRVWNGKLSSDDIGFTPFNRDYFRTITVS